MLDAAINVLQQVVMHHFAHVAWPWHAVADLAQATILYSQDEFTDAKICARQEASMAWLLA